MHSRVPVGTLVYCQSCHGTARTLPSCTVLCEVSSLSGRWLIDSLVMALRGLRPLVSCYAKSRPCRDVGMSAITRNVYSAKCYGFWEGGIHFWESEKNMKFTFVKAKVIPKIVFVNINSEYNLVFANIKK